MTEHVNTEKTLENYAHVIMRTPGGEPGRGETSVDLGAPDVPKLHDQVAQYKSVVESFGITVTELPALVSFPDSYFVEDVAIVVPEFAVITRPGAASRQSEPDHMIETLKAHREIARIVDPGTLDGGDVLIVGHHCIVGLSARTNRQGAEQLAQFLRPFNYRTDIVEVPEALHFKSSVNFIASNTLLTTSACQSMRCLDGYQKLVVPDDERYAANVVWMNGRLLVPKGYPGTQNLLEKHGFETVVMAVSEVEKMDGGLTCLSLRIT
ncbi:MAG: arginine deiminase family protein [Pseudomonadota bacterium]